eukprot:2524094-Pyramimonas_sp.AAC.1
MATRLQRLLGALRPGSLHGGRCATINGSNPMCGRMTYATLGSDQGRSDASQFLDVPQYCVWGAGTGIGKSLVSAGICHELSQSG